MVGIAAGIPAPHDPANHVRLGDDVVSSGQGVVQYDLTKRHPDSTLEVRSILPPPSTLLLGAVRGLEVGRLSGRRPWEAYIAGASGIAVRPSDEDDKLFVVRVNKRLCWKQIPHPPDSNRIPQQPRIHYGLIGSGNCLLKDIQERDRLAKALGIRAVEMEGAGVADAAWNQTEVSHYLVLKYVNTVTYLLLGSDANVD